MRILMWHLSSFRFKPKSKGRTSVIEEKRTVEADNCLLVFCLVEKKDVENTLEVVEKACKEIKEQMARIKVATVVLHSFAHLFGEPASPDAALESLKLMEEKLLKDGAMVSRTPFGWFGELTIKAKGHPLSRVARKY